MAARLGRPLKGTDVKKHPRVFGESEGSRKAPKSVRAPVRGAGLAKRKVPAKPVVSNKPRPQVERKQERVIRTLKEFLALGVLDFLPGKVEYASTAEYKKKGRK